jgi:hypothetical protein
MPSWCVAGQLYFKLRKYMHLSITQMVSEPQKKLKCRGRSSSEKVCYPSVPNPTS